MSDLGFRDQLGRYLDIAFWLLILIGANFEPITQGQREFSLIKLFYNGKLKKNNKKYYIIAVIKYNNSKGVVKYGGKDYNCKD